MINAFIFVTNASICASVSLLQGPLFLRSPFRLNNKRVIVDLFLRSLWAISLGAMPSLAHQSVARRSSSWLWLFPGISGSVYQEHNQGEGVYNFSLRRAKYLSQEKLLWTMSCGFFWFDFTQFAAQRSKTEYKVSDAIYSSMSASVFAARRRQTRACFKISGCSSYIRLG